MDEKDIQKEVERRIREADNTPMPISVKKVIMGVNNKKELIEKLQEMDEEEGFTDKLDYLINDLNIHRYPIDDLDEKDVEYIKNKKDLDHKIYANEKAFEKVKKADEKYYYDTILPLLKQCTMDYGRRKANSKDYGFFLYLYDYYDSCNWEVESHRGKTKFTYEREPSDRFWCTRSKLLDALHNRPLVKYNKEMFDKYKNDNLTEFSCDYDYYYYGAGYNHMNGPDYSWIEPSRYNSWAETIDKYNENIDELIELDKRLFSNIDYEEEEDGLYTWTYKNDPIEKNEIIANFDDIINFVDDTSEYYLKKRYGKLKTDKFVPLESCIDILKDLIQMKDDDVKMYLLEHKDEILKIKKYATKNIDLKELSEKENIAFNKVMKKSMFEKGTKKLTSKSKKTPNILSLAKNEDVK